MTSPFQINDIIAAPSKLAILRILVSHPGLKATGREIAKLSGYSAPSTHESLKDLQSRNILTIEIIGKQHIYALNENDRIVQKIIRPMFKAESGVKEEIRDFLLNQMKKLGVRKRLISLILYGSAQRGAVVKGSDVDIAVILSKATDVERMTDLFVSTIAPQFRAYFGVQLDFYVKSAVDFRQRLKKNLPPVSTLIKSYSVLYGKEPLEI
jgi:predicted nucleotidyltransferase